MKRDCWPNEFLESAKRLRSIYLYKFYRSVAELVHCISSYLQALFNILSFNTRDSVGVKQDIPCLLIYPCLLVRTLSENTNNILLIPENYLPFLGPYFTTPHTGADFTLISDIQGQ